MALVEKAAGQGHAYAMCELGSIHTARREFEQAVKWFTKGAEAGLPDAISKIPSAMYNLGSSLTEGGGGSAGPPSGGGVVHACGRRRRRGSGDQPNMCTLSAAAGGSSRRST